MSALRISELINASNRRELSDHEQIELKALLGCDSDRDGDDGGWIGGRDLAVLNYDTVDALDDANDGNDSDDSDFEGKYANDPPLLDMADIDAAEEEIANAGIDDDVAETVEVAAAAEANRGPRYVGQGKNDKTVWWSMPTASERTRTVKLERDRSIYSYVPVVKQVFVDKKGAFKSIMHPRIIDTIVTETNRKAKRVIKQNKLSATPKRMRPWKDLTENELYAFMGLVLYAGADKNNLVEAKDLFAKHKDAIYRATMSLERFEQITRFLRFDDARTRPARLETDKLASFRYIWILFLNHLAFNYHPTKELFIDEQLLNTHNRCPIRQYIPSKPGKYGIKINWIVDASTSFPLFGEIYCGTLPPDEAPATGNAHQLVIRLANRWMNNGANITMNNCFTSYALATDLWRNHKTTMVGTMRTNKREIPKPFSSSDAARQRGKYASVFCFSDECQLTCYTTNKEKGVVLLSTAHATEQTDPSTIPNKPQVVLDYNKFKGGVDSFDQMLREYTSTRKSSRWPVALFYNMVDVAALAAFKLYTISHPIWHFRTIDKRKQFLRDLARELIDDHLHDRSKSKRKSTLKRGTVIALGLIDFKPANTSVFRAPQPTQVIFLFFSAISIIRPMLNFIFYSMPNLSLSHLFRNRSPASHARPTEQQDGSQKQRSYAICAWCPIAISITSRCVKGVTCGNSSLRAFLKKKGMMMTYHPDLHHPKDGQPRPTS